MVSNILFRSVFWRGSYFLSVLLLNLIISRHFGAEMSGMIFYSSTVFSFIMLLLSISLEAGMGYCLSSGKLNPLQLGILSVVWTSIILVLLFFSYPYWEKYLGDYFTYHERLIFSLSFIGGNLLITYFVALFHAKLNFKSPQLMLCIMQFLLILSFSIPEISQLTISDKTYISLYFISFPFSGTLLATVFFGAYAKRSDLSLLSTQAFKDLVFFSSNAFLINMLTFLLRRADLVIVEKYCTPETLGNYIQVNKLSQMFYLLPVMLASALFPLTAGGMHAAVNEKLQSLSRWIVTGYLMIGLLVALTGYWIFPFLLGNSFNQMYLPMMMAFPGIIAYSLAHLLAAYFSGCKMLFVNLRGISLCLFLLIILDLLLIPLGGIIMASLVTSFTSVAYFAYLYWWHHQLHRISIHSFFIIKSSDFNHLFSWMRR